MTFSHQWLFHGNIALRPPYSLVCGSALKNLGLWAIGIWLLFSFDLCICRFSKDLTAHEHLWHGIGQGFARWQHSGVWNETLMPGDWSDSSPTLCDDLGFIVLLIVGIQLCTLLLPSNLPHISHGAIGIWWLEEVPGIWCRGHQRWGQGLHTCIFSSFGPFKIYKKEPDVHMRITFFKTHWCPAPTDNVSFHCNFWRCWQWTVQWPKPASWSSSRAPARKNLYAKLKKLPKEVRYFKRAL